MKKGDEPAFPFSAYGEKTEIYRGLTKREYVAAMAMQAYIALNDQKQDHEAQIVDAVWMADKLLTELEQ